MALLSFEYQEHGYRNGHQLLRGSIQLPKHNQDIVDQLSDISGPIRPGEKFSPYITAYPLIDQQYYVIARTWQDIGASRAGCVVTRSIFIPFDLWKNAKDLTQFFHLLEQPPETLSETPNYSCRPLEVTLEPIFDNRLMELTEALFLEPRQSIVMFDFQPSESAAIRLLTALWPSLRESFALCTYALSPRMLANRKFDLLFSPKSARSRFAKSEIRKIDGISSGETVARHKWTELLMQRIFITEKPELFVDPMLFSFGIEVKPDPSALRLSLLWAELIENARTSPEAVLGLIDIIRSQSNTIENALEQIVPIIDNSIRIAISSYGPSEAWDFLFTLLGKILSETPVPAGVLYTIEDGVRKLSLRSPGIVFDTFLAHEHDLMNAPNVLFAGAGNGLAESKAIVREKLCKLSPVSLLKLFAYSPSFAQQFLAESPEYDAAWSEIITSGIIALNGRLNKELQQNILPFISKPWEASFLPQLLGKANSEILCDSVRILYKNSQFKYKEFDLPLVEVFAQSGKLDTLRKLLLGLGQDRNVDRFIRETLDLNDTDIRWLARAKFNKDRKADILLHLLRTAESYSLNLICKDQVLVNIMIDILKSYPEQSALELARLIVCSDTNFETAIEIGLEIFPYLPISHQKSLAPLMLKKCFADDTCIPPSSFKKVISIIHPYVLAEEVVQFALPERINGAQLSKNIICLKDLSSHQYIEILFLIDGITYQLIQGAAYSLNASAIRAWSDMIAASATVNPKGQYNAAVQALSFALNIPDKRFSPIILTCFPIFYKALGAGREIPFPMSLFWFTDWDRCKAARKEITSCYLRSQWPPADLLVLADELGISSDIVKDLMTDQQGRAFLDSALQDLGRLPDKKKNKIMKLLQNLS